jgi:hypothetical protein
LLSWVLGQDGEFIERNQIFCLIASLGITTLTCVSKL